jgi:tetratricopeptide (TPR) repeat protein
MRRLRPLLLVAALACSATLSADQKDGDLPDLFGKLKQADSPQQAVMIEAEIWKKWYEREGPVGGDSMAEVVEAMSAGRYTIALNLLNTLVTDQPDFAEAWNRRATIHYLLGNYEDSLADIEQTLTLEPRHFGALSGIGLIMQQLGENEKALHAFEQVLEISPQNIGAAKSVKDLETKLGTSI